MKLWNYVSSIFDVLRVIDDLLTDLPLFFSIIAAFDNNVHQFDACNAVWYLSEAYGLTNVWVDVCKIIQSQSYHYLSYAINSAYVNV
jgi:hypothetical protein